MPTPTSGSDEIEAAILLVVRYDALDLTISHHSGWTIYQLEDGRVAVSYFENDGKDHSREEIFDNPWSAVQRFLRLTKMVG